MTDVNESRSLYLHGRVSTSSVPLLSRPSLSPMTLQSESSGQHGNLGFRLGVTDPSKIFSLSNNVSKLPSIVTPTEERLRGPTTVAEVASFPPANDQPITLRLSPPPPPPLAPAKSCTAPVPIAPMIGSRTNGGMGCLYQQNSHKKKTAPRSVSTAPRLNKFVRRLHDMLQSEKDSGIVEWRRGLLVLHSTSAFAKKILPKYFNTRNFKTFRRQLNYYGFVHVRSFSATGSTTTALWVNQDLAKRGTKSISSVLMLKRVEPCEASKTAEGRRVRKEEAVHTVEDIGISTKSLQLEQIRGLALRGRQPDDDDSSCEIGETMLSSPSFPMIVHCHHREYSAGSQVDPQVHPVAPVSSGGKQWPNSSENGPLCPKPSTTGDAANILMMLSRST